MKKDFIIILVLIIFAIFGIYVSCTSADTDSNDGKRMEKTTFNQIDVALLVASNDETAAMGCPCRTPGNIARCKAGKGDCAPWNSWDEYTYCVSLHLESCR